MKLIVFFLACVSAGNVLAEATQTEAKSDWRVGIGRVFLYNDPDRAYSRSEESWHYGWQLSADYSHNQYFAARANVYDLNGSENVSGQGGELQLLGGYNLNGQGIRLYTGPLWFYEKRNDKSAIHDKKHVFSDFGWHLGAGYQWQRWSLDISASLRNNQDYVDYYEDKNVDLSKDEVWAVASFATISYQL